MRIKYRLTLSTLALALATAACGGGSGGALAPQFQPQVVNTPNTQFSFQATGLTNIDDVLVYNWSCSSGNIVIHPSTVTTGGTITLTIKDAGGTVIYSGDVPPSGDITPAGLPGTVGSWRIKVALVNYSGTINFAVQQM